MKNLTIGITTFSRKRYLIQSIRSILNQNSKGINLIISNDNPNRKITFKYLNLKPNKKIKIFNHKKNLGPVKNKNFVLKKTKTEWFSWLSDDDVLNKDFVNQLSSLYKSSKNRDKIVAVYSNFKDNNGKTITTKKNLLFDRNDFIENYTSGKIKLVGIYGLLKTKYLKKIKGVKLLSYPFSPYCDNLLALELSNHGKIAYINRKLCRFRIHKGSQSNSSAPISVWLNAQINYLKILNYLIKNDDEIFKSKIIRNTLTYFNNNISDLLKRNNKRLLKNLIFVYYYQIKYLYKNINIKYWPSEMTWLICYPKTIR